MEFCPKGSQSETSGNLSWTYARRKERRSRRKGMTLERQSHRETQRERALQVYRKRRSNQKAVPKII